MTHNKKIITEKKRIIDFIEKESRNGDGLAMLVKAGFIIILALFLLFIYNRNSATDVAKEDISNELLKSTDVAEVMSPASDRDTMQFLGLDATKYEYTIYYRNTTALAVDELLIVKVKDTSSLASISDTVQKRIDSQIKAYEGYGAEQVKLLKSAVTLKKGDYYFYCTATNAEKYKEVLLDVIQ
ncbi:MAG: DUF4358 domain-containing protein [Clostridiales bacterium]|nr:DUF4358 domain-containing protein [Clostridiales bacterium]